MDDFITCLIDHRLLDNRRIRKPPYTVRELERAVGMSHQGLLNIRSGLSEPKLGTAIRIATALGSTVEDLWPLEQFCDKRRMD